MNNGREAFSFSSLSFTEKAFLPQMSPGDVCHAAGEGFCLFYIHGRCHGACWFCLHAMPHCLAATAFFLLISFFTAVLFLPPLPPALTAPASLECFPPFSPSHEWPFLPSSFFPLPHHHFSHHFSLSLLLTRASHSPSLPSIEGREGHRP